MTPRKSKKKKIDLELRKNLLTGEFSVWYSSASSRLLHTISHAGCYTQYHTL